MGKFKVKDYSNIDNASKKMLTTAQTMVGDLEDANYSMQTFYNESTFYGPIADHCLEALDIINRATINNVDHLAKSAQTMDTINQGYAQTDEKVSKEVGGV